MDVIKLNYHLNEGYWKIINSLRTFEWRMIGKKKDIRKYKILNRNVQFKNIHKNNRVFIVANGPSIKNENLDLIKGEYVFTVNQMIRKKEFVDLNPICNFWFDPAYFDENMPEDSKKEFESLFSRTCNCNDHIVSILPYSAYDFIEKRSLNNDKVYYIDGSLYFYDGYDLDFDFTKLTPGFQNIVQYAIATAVYMGFNEIYILGCDSTGIETKINSVMEKSIEDNYSLDLGTEGQKYVNSLLNYFSVEEQFKGWTRIFHLYDQLLMYCKKRNVKLVNCTSQTIIEGIPRKSLESVLKNE